MREGILWVVAFGVFVALLFAASAYGEATMAEYLSGL